MALTKRDLDKARKAEAAAGPRATSARYRRASGRIEVGYDNGVTVAVPVQLIQEFAMLPEFPSPTSLSKVEVWADGRVIWFPKLEASIYAPSFMKGIFGTRAWMAEIARGTGPAKSAAKPVVARANPKKTGRPRKADASEAKRTTSRRRASAHESGARAI
jgi:hypothetical protein